MYKIYKTCVHCHRRSFSIVMGMLLLLLQIMTWFTNVEPPHTLLFEEVWEELKPCLTGFSSLAWPDKPQHRNVLSQFSSPGPASPAELFQCREYNLFLSLLKIMGRYTSAESATIFLWVLDNWHSVIASNARLLYFHILCKCECWFRSFLPQRPERTCCILWQSSDYSFLFQAQHWGEVISLPNSECKVIRRRKWKTGFLDLDWKPSTFSFPDRIEFNIYSSQQLWSFSRPVANRQGTVT